MPARKLTKQQAGQLGGLRTARLHPEEQKTWSARGGNTTAERYGREHYIRAAHKRWGRLEGGTSHEA